MVDACKAAATAARYQMPLLGLEAKVRLTPMIVVNDVSSEIFLLQDAAQLVDFAKSTVLTTNR